MTRADAMHATLATLESALRRIAPHGVDVAARWISEADVPNLHLAELDAVAAAAPGRRREFASGRALLRQMIGRDVAVPADPDRRPVVPDGLVASLAHDAELVVAALAPATRATALGIDIEPSVALEPGVAAVILRPDEADVDPLVAFVAKEAAYKAWSQVGGRMLDHHDVRLMLRGRRFVATVEPDRFEISGAYIAAAGRIGALAVVERGQALDDAWVRSGRRTQPGTLTTSPR